MEAREALASELLQGICDDILDVQIGTLMFWDDDELSKDPFAEYVHHWLLRASRQMGGKHYDSSAVWDRPGSWRLQ